MFVNEDLHNTQKAKCRKTCTGLIHNNFWRVKEEKLGGALIVGVTFFFLQGLKKIGQNIYISLFLGLGSEVF